jgi:hypothetical protein
MIARCDGKSLRRGLLRAEIATHPQPSVLADQSASARVRKIGLLRKWVHFLKIKKPDFFSSAWCFFLTGGLFLILHAPSRKAPEIVAGGYNLGGFNGNGKHAGHELEITHGSLSLPLKRAKASFYFVKTLTESF